MRAIALTAFALLLATLSSAAPEFVSEFESFKVKYGKSYASPDEEARRFKIFAENMVKARAMQATNPHATFGANGYSDLSEAEFKSYHNGQRHFARAVESTKKAPTETYTKEQRAAAGKAVDWRTKGAVTPIKNQGQCGSCWSFSTTGGIEGQWFLAGNKLTSLSEQELVSCDTIDHGCDGGLMDNAFTWLLQNKQGKIVTEQSYPYVSGGGQVPACSSSGHTFGAQISSYKNIAHNEDDMATFVYSSGPLSIAVDATSWQTYTGGIMTNCQSTRIDHGVLIVGFDDNNNPPYWIVKNSWGTIWGEDGYIRVQKGTDQCLITSYPCSSIVNKSGPTPAPRPSPSPGPGPSPSPSGASFVQKTCSDAKCQDCTSVTLPQKQCIKGTHGSYTAECDTNGLLVREYTSSDCIGTRTEVMNAINTCSIIFGLFDTESFVQNECGATPPGPNPPGPNPPPPPPPAPTVTPAPAATFTQKQCTSATCTTGCESHTFPQNACLRLSSGGSAKAACHPSDLVLTVYPESQDCTGASTQQAQPINTCERDTTGTYFENVCPTSAAVDTAAVKLSRSVMLARLRKMIGKN